MWVNRNGKIAKIAKIKKTVSTIAIKIDCEHDTSTTHIKVMAVKRINFYAETNDCIQI